MKKENYITENIHSNNAFVSQLYSELEERIKAFENHEEDSYIQRITISTAIFPFIAVSLEIFLIIMVLTPTGRALIRLLLSHL